MVNGTKQFTDMINNPAMFTAADILNNEIYSGLIQPT